MTGVSVQPLARYAVNRCRNNKHPISNLHLQRMLYVLQLAYCRSQNGRTLLFPDEFHAWPHGPIMVKVYDEFSIHGGMPIKRIYHDTLECSDDISEFLNDGIDVLSYKSPWDLVRITHAPGSPWHQVYDNGSGRKKRIDNELLIEAVRKGMFYGAESACVGLDQHSSLRKEGAKCACVSEQICQNKGHCTKCKPLKRDR